MVSIIVPTYIPDGDCALINDKFFSSLAKHTKRENYELIVVDNGSKCGMFPPFIDVLVNRPEPLGYARATNIGLALARHDTMVVINNDIVLSPEWLEKLLDQYRAHGPGVLSAWDGGHSRQGCPEVWTDSWYSLWMTDRITFSKVGYLDESLPYRFHDQDYSIRMVKAGYKVQRTSLVSVQHAESSTYNKMDVKKEENMERNTMITRYGYQHFIDWYNAVGQFLQKG